MARGDSLIEQVKKRAKCVIPEITEPTHRFEGRLISSGSTLYDLACSDTILGAYLIGSMVNIVGDKSSGKTTLALSVLAEASQNPDFDEYELILDDVEAANEFDVAVLFGQQLADRLRAPTENGASDTVAELQNNIINTIKRGKPFIYVLDSFDALTTDEELERAYAKADGKELKGSYGTQKAKGSSELFRVITREMKNANGLLIIISQVRENIDPMSFAKYRRTGGKALDFYATNITWLANKGTIKKMDRDVGNEVAVKVDKNKLTGKHRVINYQTITGYGIDDIGSMVDFMIVEKFWLPKAATEKKVEKSEGRKPRQPKTTADKNVIVRAKNLGLEGNRASIITQIEDQGLRDQLRNEVFEAWNTIESKLHHNRPSKY